MGNLDRSSQCKKRPSAGHIRDSGIPDSEGTFGGLPYPAPRAACRVRQRQGAPTPYLPMLVGTQARH